MDKRQEGLNQDINFVIKRATFTPNKTSTPRHAYAKCETKEVLTRRGK